MKRNADTREKTRIHASTHTHTKGKKNCVHDVKTFWHAGAVKF